MALTPEALAQLRRLRSDFEFYAPRILKIRDKAGSIVPLRLNRAQRFLHAEVERQRAETGKVRIIGLKGRQQGFSTYVEGRFYWKVSGEFGKRAFILTHLAEATGNLFGMTRRYHEHAPAQLKPSTRQFSATGIEFDRLGSEFSVATAGSSGTGRSATAQYFHGSEVAYWPNAIEHMAGIGQIVPNLPGTEIILESTANGVGNLFHGMCMDALAGKGDYRLLFVPWYWQDEYALEPPRQWVPSANDVDYGEAYKLTRAQMYWRRQKIITDFRGDESLFDQEYPATVALAFSRASGDVFIPIALVERARKTLHVEARGARIMGLDPAEYGTDDTVLIGRVGRDAATLYQRWHGKGQMAVVGAVARIADRWHPDSINVDVTGGYGSGIADRLRELGYPVLRVNFGETAVQDDKYPRRLDEMWGDMKAWLEDAPCKLPDDDLLQTELCMRQFTYDSSRRTVLDSKERMRARGLKSPDGADALALTFALPARPKARTAAVAPFANPGGMGY
jgi:hypothetical protein